MDIAYDHILEETLATSDNNPKHNIGRKAEGEDGKENEAQTSTENESGDLGAEFQESLRALQQNPWGQKLGSLWGEVRQRGENVYKEAKQEYSAASEEAAKGLSGWRETLVRQTRGLSLGGKSEEGLGGKEKQPEQSAEGSRAAGEDEGRKSDEGPNFLSKFREEAAKRLKDLQKAEDAADEALIRFGTNLTSFFKDAISVTGPEDTSNTSGDVMFESRDRSGKRVIHASRLEAQLHVIHTNTDRLMSDPDSQAWPEWKKNFKVEEKTADIANDLEKYPELRKAMEALVPEKVAYGDFWCRYYFLRHIVETEDQRRKEILKGATAEDEEEVDWDDDSEEEDHASTSTVKKPTAPSSKNQDKEEEAKDTKLLSPRHSHDQQSQPDSDASYDVVSGTATPTPDTPKGKEAVAAPAAAAKKEEEEESSDEDWE